MLNLRLQLEKKQVSIKQGKKPGGSHLFHGRKGLSDILGLILFSESDILTKIFQVK